MDEPTTGDTPPGFDFDDSPLLFEVALSMFVDSSGLDAAAAVGVMNEIRRIATSEKLIVVATIHQPSNRVFEKFDQLMLLSKGREAYCGPAADATKYFASLGFKIPGMDQKENRRLESDIPSFDGKGQKRLSPADFLLDLINSDITPVEEVDKILDTWQQEKTTSHNNNDVLALKSAAVAKSGSIWHETKVMMHRHGLLVVRDPVLYIGRAVIQLVFLSFMGFMFWDTRERLQEFALSRLYLVLMYLLGSSIIAVVVPKLLNEEYKVLLKEVRNGMVSPLSYLVSKSILEVPMMFIFALAAIGIPNYVISDFYISNFGTFFMLAVSQLYAWEAIAHACAVAAEDSNICTNIFTVVWFLAAAASGLHFKEEEFVWPFRLFYYILPDAYALRSMWYVENKDTTWETCGLTTRICWGMDGKTVINNVGLLYPASIYEDTIANDLWAMLAIAVGFKVVYSALLCYRVFRVSTITLGSVEGIARSTGSAHKKISPASAQADDHAEAIKILQAKLAAAEHRAASVRLEESAATESGGHSTIEV